MSFCFLFVLPPASETFPSFPHQIYICFLDILPPDTSCSMRHEHTVHVFALHIKPQLFYLATFSEV